MKIFEEFNSLEKCRQDGLESAFRWIDVNLQNTEFPDCAGEQVFSIGQKNFAGDTAGNFTVAVNQLESPVAIGDDLTPVYLRKNPSVRQVEWSNDGITWNPFRSQDTRINLMDQCLLLDQLAQQLSWALTGPLDIAGGVVYPFQSSNEIVPAYSVNAEVSGSLLEPIDSELLMTAILVPCIVRHTVTKVRYLVQYIGADVVVDTDITLAISFDGRQTWTSLPLLNSKLMMNHEDTNEYLFAGELDVTVSGAAPFIGTPRIEILGNEHVAYIKVAAISLIY